MTIPQPLEQLAASNVGLIFGKSDLLFLENEGAYHIWAVMGDSPRTNGGPQVVFRYAPTKSVVPQFSLARAYPLIDNENIYRVVLKDQSGNHSKQYLFHREPEEVPSAAQRIPGTEFKALQQRIREQREEEYKRYKNAIRVRC